MRWPMVDHVFVYIVSNTVKEMLIEGNLIMAMIKDQRSFSDVRDNEKKRRLDWRTEKEKIHSESHLSIMSTVVLPYPVVLPLRNAIRLRGSIDGMD